MPLRAEPMHIVHDSHDSSSRPDLPDVMCLQIERGSTRFPLRTLPSSRFLIGAGTNCHLQLGGDLPMLHSLLIREASGWRIEAIAPAPDLLVNGVKQRSYALATTDVVEIGPFRFRLSDPEALRPAASRLSRTVRSGE